MDHAQETSHDNTRWFAAWTRSRQEKSAASVLDSIGIESFLPLKSEIRQWSDRKQTVAMPLFSGYLFVRMSLTGQERLDVLKTPGIAGIVGNQTGPLAVPDQQIEEIRRVLESQSAFEVEPLLQEGDRVRVASGPLAGIEGKLVRRNSSAYLAISIEILERRATIQQ
jgi:transcriptional antiterminator RfaH